MDLEANGVPLEGGEEREERHVQPGTLFRLLQHRPNASQPLTLRPLPESEEAEDTPGERDASKADAKTAAETSADSVDAPVLGPPPLPQGRGQYQLKNEIARGGMGIVLRGHDVELGRDVAMKVLDADLVDRPDAVQRFVEEAQIGGQLQHPGIVPVYDLGVLADQRPYFTMKLVRGRTLAERLAARSDPHSERARLLGIFEAVCQTMAYAHARGVLHRDLKPANIMVGAFGEVQVVDWGVAKVLDRPDVASAPEDAEGEVMRRALATVRKKGGAKVAESLVGSILGTLEYMPPEQACGRVHDLDERADVFALGAILCEVLTGQPPYVGAPEEVLSAAALGQIDAAVARLEASGSAQAMVALARECLQPDATDRPRNAGVVARRVRDHLVSVEERAQAAVVEAASANVRAVQERRARQRILAVGAALVTLVLLGTGAWLFVQTQNGLRQRAATARLREEARAARELGTRVHRELFASALHSGAERWDAALHAAERARELARSQDARPELTAAIATALHDVHTARDAAQARERRAREHETLLRAVREIRRRTGDQGAAFEALFLQQGLSLPSIADTDAARQAWVTESLEVFGAHELGAEMASALDAWHDALALPESAQGQRAEETGALRAHLLALAQALDPDPERVRMRDAVARGDEDELLAMAVAHGNGSTRPTATSALLGVSLLRLDRSEEALRVLRASVVAHPDDFDLLFELASALTPLAHDAAARVLPREQGEEGDRNEAARYWQAALTLEPEDAASRAGLAAALPEASTDD